MRVVLCFQILRWFLFAATITVGIGLCNGNYLGVPTCNESEKQSLLMLKKELKDPSNRLSSWITDEDSDCCSWAGVVCDDLTGHIHELHLGNPDYSNYLGGSIPHQLGNLSSLRDLRVPVVFAGILKVENLEWISGLSQLKHLDMSGVNLSKASDWLQVANMLPSLEELYLSDCELDHIPPLPVTNFTSLAILDLSGNYFYSSIPRWFFSLRNIVSLKLYYSGFEGPILSSPNNITSLKEIDFSGNNLNQSLPEWLFNQKCLTHLNLAQNSLQGLLLEGFSNMSALKSVDLSENNFSGHISVLFERSSSCASYKLESLRLRQNDFSGHLTPQIGHFKRLSYLDLSSNHFDGALPETIGHLTMLTYLDISHNSFEGALPETVGHLTMLTDFYISHNSFEGLVSQVHFTHLMRLESFIANGNTLTLKLIKNQWNLKYLSLSNTEISGTIPNWFWNSSSQFIYLNLSHNHLCGEIDYIHSIIVDLSHNQFTGSLPLVSAGVNLLDLSNASFSGSVSHFFCDKIDEPRQLTQLFVSNNLLSGNIPDCWKYWQHLMILDLGSNNLTGSIPSSIGHLRELQSLHLRSNHHLSGEFPLSMQNCTSLVVLDMGANKFSGSLPTWIGKSLLSLVVLSFRSNTLQGDIPHQFCNLTKLQILDLAHNNISGTIPRCLGNFSAMVYLSPTYNGMLAAFYYGYSVGRMDRNMLTHMDTMFLVTKGREVEYNSILGYVTSMDLSGNIISGNIPEELTNLVSLQTLNLSKNLLTGRIPSKIGNMVHLESMDLSKNKLSGKIPISLSNLTFLNHLNLFYNNLTGQIPLSTQLQSLDQSNFAHNELCGPPLAKNCSAKSVIPPTDERDSGYNILEDQWFYLSLGLGFMFGFWTILGSLLVNLPWSAAFSRFLNSIVLKHYGVILKYL